MKSKKTNIGKGTLILSGVFIIFFLFGVFAQYVISQEKAKTEEEKTQEKLFNNAQKLTEKKLIKEWDDKTYKDKKKDINYIIYETNETYGGKTLKLAFVINEINKTG